MLSPGDVVDRFTVVELLGVGGLAQVYKVRHRVLGSMHALKVVTAGGSAVARRLLREGSIQAQLRHPNLVAVTDVIEVRGHSALVLEYVEGVTLQGLLAEKGELPTDEALALFSQVLAGVAAAHAAGVLHRDLKPGNILLAPGPMGVMAKVTDFGLAKMLVDDAPVGAGDTIQGLVMGTPGYMAPEQAGSASTADARADVFALGVVLYEMLTGIQPFTRTEIQATLAATLLGDHTPLGEVLPDLPPGLADTVERCIAVDRMARFADARELARALYGDRPELAEIVEGRRTAVPLAISLPSVMPLRPAGVGSAALDPANPTMAPGFGDEGLGRGTLVASADTMGMSGAGPVSVAVEPVSRIGPRGAVGASVGGTLGGGVDRGAVSRGTTVDGTLEAAAPSEDTAGASPETSPPPSRAPLALAVAFGFLLVVGVVGGGLWFVGAGHGGDAGPERAGASANAGTVATETIPAAPVGTPLDGSAAAGTPSGPPASGTPVSAMAPAASTPDGTAAVGTPAPRTDGSAATGGPAAATRAPAAASDVAPRPDPEAAAPAAVTPDVVAAAAAETRGMADPSAAGASTGAASAAEPVVADAAPPDPTPTAPATPDPTLGKLVGTWEGVWEGRPFTVAFERAGGDRVNARVDVLLGTSYRTIRLSGSLDTATGRVTVTEESGAGWWLDGKLDGGQLVGAMRHPEKKKASSYTARRR